MKVKTKKIAAKRFRVTKNGKVLHRRQNLRHLRVHKSKRQLRSYRKTASLGYTQAKLIRQLLPYQ